VITTLALINEFPLASSLRRTVRRGAIEKLCRGIAGMELRSVKAKELLEMVQRFRARAVDCEPGYYRELILRTAGELEAHARKLAAEDGSVLVLFGDDETPQG
jgi:hypothetical protein